MLRAATSVLPVAWCACQGDLSSARPDAEMACSHRRA